MSISLWHSRLLAVVLVVVAAVSLGFTTPAFAQFVQVVDPSDPNVFRFRQEIVRENLVAH